MFKVCKGELPGAYTCINTISVITVQSMSCKAELQILTDKTFN